jgi:hypothetical protein
MDAVRRLRPVLLGTVGWAFFVANAPAGPPCVGDACEAGAAYFPCGPEGCDSTSCGRADCPCARGGRCVHHDGRVRRWSEEWYAIHGHGPVGASQKHRAGKSWPPYPRPLHNGECTTQFHAAHYWPYPYNCWDRAWVKNVLAVQTANGWAQATTLCCHHFDAETNCLNDAGRIHLRWILHQAPPQYRTIYVDAGDSAEVSFARQSSVEAESATMAGVGGAPIIVRPVQTAGRPANEVDALRRAELSTMPQPRIQLQSVGTGAGGGL